MFTTFLIGLLFIVTLVLFSGVIKWHEGYGTGRTQHVLPRVFGLIPLGLAVIVLLFSTLGMVQAKQVGVVTTFGKPGDDTLSSGLYVKAPWQKVTEIDATIQTDEYHGDNAISVILADKNTASISATVRWAVNEKNANTVYADFRSDDPTKSLRDAVVSTQFKAAVNATFAKYDATAPGDETTDTLASKVESVLLAKTEGLVDIESVTISYIKPGDRLQAKIEAIQAQSSQTTIATEKKATATEEAAANRILSDSISNDPNVLVSKCFDLLAEGAFTPPAGFSCWPGGNGAVVVPSAK